MSTWLTENMCRIEINLQATMCVKLVIYNDGYNSLDYSADKEADFQERHRCCVDRITSIG